MEVKQVYDFTNNAVKQAIGDSVILNENCIVFFIQ